MSASTKRPLLVVAHEATLTGSPAVLLHLLRRTRGQLGVPLRVRLLAGGPAAADLRALDDRTPPEATPCAVLVNSALGAGELWAVEADVPAAVYVHEQGDALRSLPAAAVQALCDRADLLLAAAPGVERDLVALGAAEDRVRLLPPLIDVDRPDDALTGAAIAAVDAREHTRVVLGCGSASWRKGTDLFVALAARLAAERDDVSFAWVGRRSTTFRQILDLDCAASGVQSSMRWVDEVSDARPFLALADVVVVPSREDPQPLVPLEAAICGTPTAGFCVGGLATMADAGALQGAAYPDVVELSQKVALLLDDPAAASSTLELAVAWTELHHDPTALAASFVDLVHELMGRRPQEETT